MYEADQASNSEQFSEDNGFHTALPQVPPPLARALCLDGERRANTLRGLLEATRAIDAAIDAGELGYVAMVAVKPNRP